MTRQGYDITKFMALYKRLAYGLIEPVAPPKLRLSVTVALEHFTASFAEGVLRTGELDDLHPVMRDLIRWHASEEIEHKAVAFDVLQRVDPSYSLRIAGLVVGGGMLLFFWYLAAAMLIASDDAPAEQVIRDGWRAFASGEITNGDFRRAFVGYLRPDFHPWQLDNAALAEAALASLETPATAA